MRSGRAILSLRLAVMGFALAQGVLSATAQSPATPPKRANEAVSKLQANGTLNVQIYYAQDKDEVVKTEYGPEVVKQMYSAPIRMTKESDGSVDAKYYGVLYAQCTGGVCSVQGYDIHLDSCGRILNFFPDTTLKSFNPAAPGLHTLLPPAALSRLIFYANNPQIMSLIYEDVAGSDLASNYVLGNSIPLDANGVFIQNAQDAKTSSNKAIPARSRWGMNPWATNTTATFFIHLDMMRKSLRKLGLGKVGPDNKACPVWPKFKGQTPVPRLVKKKNMTLTARFLDDAQKAESLGERRLDNFEAEQVITAQAKATGQPAFTTPVHVSPGPDTSELLNSVTTFYARKGDADSIEHLTDKITKMDASQKHEYLTLLLSKMRSDMDSAKALKLAQTEQKVWENGVLSPEGKDELFAAFRDYFSTTRKGSIVGSYEGITAENLDNIQLGAQGAPPPGMSAKDWAAQDTAQRKTLAEFKQDWKILSSGDGIAKPPKLPVVDPTDSEKKESGKAETTPPAEPPPQQ